MAKSTFKNDLIDNSQARIKLEDGDLEQLEIQNEFEFIDDTNQGKNSCIQANEKHPSETYLKVSKNQGIRAEISQIIKKINDMEYKEPRTFFGKFVKGAVFCDSKGQKKVSFSVHDIKEYNAKEKISKMVSNQSLELKNKTVQKSSEVNSDPNKVKAEKDDKKSKSSDEIDITERHAENLKLEDDDLLTFKKSGSGIVTYSKEIRDAVAFSNKRGIDVIHTPQVSKIPRLDQDPRSNKEFQDISLRSNDDFKVKFNESLQAPLKVPNHGIKESDPGIVAIKVQRNLTMLYYLKNAVEKLPKTQSNSRTNVQYSKSLATIKPVFAKRTNVQTKPIKIEVSSSQDTTVKSDPDKAPFTENLKDFKNAVEKLPRIQNNSATNVQCSKSFATIKPVFAKRTNVQIKPIKVEVSSSQDSMVKSATDKTPISENHNHSTISSAFPTSVEIVPLLSKKDFTSNCGKNQKQDVNIVEIPRNESKDSSKNCVSKKDLFEAIDNIAETSDNVSFEDEIKTCSICCQNFTSETELKDHMTIHDPFKCTQCFQTFDNQDSILYHMKWDHKMIVTKKAR